MSDSLPQPEPDKAPPVPTPTEPMPNPPSENSAGNFVEEIEGQEVVVPNDPIAVADDRAGFKFLAIGFAIFFLIIAICAGVVAMVMKSMGI